MKQIILSIFIFFCLPFVSYAQSYLDTSFNHTGMIKDDTGVCYKIFMQSNQKIIAAGIYADAGGAASILRFNQDGSIDHSFAESGYFNHYGGITGLCYSDDNKILVSAIFDTPSPHDSNDTQDDFMCFKLNEDGSLDTSFGDGGKVITDIARWWHGYWWKHADDDASSIAIQPDGKIILYGSSFGEDLVWARYTADGRIDSTFGLYGIASYIHPVGYLQETNDMAIMTDGKIVSACMGTDSFTMAAIRLLPDGEIDSTFNHNGIAHYNGDNWLTYCKAMCLQPDDKVLLAGYGDSALIVRFDTTGALDPTFGNGGVCKLPPAAIRDMALAPDEKILVTGTKDSSFVVYRCLADGILDTTFGNNGMILTKIEAGEEDRPECIALQADGKILIGGGTRFPGDPMHPAGEFVLARYLPDGRTGTGAIPGDKGLLLVYPNPVKNDKLLIRWQGIQQPGLVNISLYDIAGRRLWYQENRTISNQPFNIDISTFAAGVYLIKVSDNKGLNEERKFLKQ